MSRSLAKAGGTCSILLGTSYVVVGVAYVLTPGEQLTGITEKFAPSYVANPTPFTLLLWACALGALVARVELSSTTHRCRRRPGKIPPLRLDTFFTSLYTVVP